MHKNSVDTDVFGLGSIPAAFQKISACELWLAFGVGSKFCIYLPIHKLCAALDPNVCATLPVLHAITGCDTVSAFGEMGKITAWNVTEL